MARVRAADTAIQHCRAGARGHNKLMDESGVGFGHSERCVSNHADRASGRVRHGGGKRMLAGASLRHFLLTDRHADRVSHRSVRCSGRGKHPAVRIFTIGKLNLALACPTASPLAPGRRCGCTAMRVSMSSPFGPEADTASPLPGNCEPFGLTEDSEALPPSRIAESRAPELLAPESWVPEPASSA